MQLQPGTRLGRYEVREKIGAGGMGVVYLAQDTSLRRPVALKVLPADLTRSEERLRRFEQEAYAASALNHPHILTVYEIGAEGDTHFIATELVEGVTLRRHAAGRRLPAHELLDIATQVASALAAAHGAGIVHRDIKPENVMLRTDGYVKVVDFGLAKLTRPQSPAGGDAEALTRRMVETQPGVVMGTVAYMSPEQARGLEVDARTDLWSLGVVLYELAAGRPPFTGATPSDVMAAVLTAEPPRPEEHVPGAPEGLLNVLRRALVKEPGARYQTAAEMLADLRQLKRRVEAESEFGETRARDSRTRTAAARDARDVGPDPGLGRSVEIAHVLFTDIVGYSRLPMDEQGRVLRRLQEVVRGTSEFRRAHEADQLISLPTGDGMALVFFGDPEAPAQCAIEISRALGERPSMGLRMGVHTGPVYRVADINASRNVAGGGINTAQRVMDCGDAGHILVSGAAAEVLGQLSGWQGKLHDLGEAEVKHGVRVRLFNLCADGVGNPELPQKLRTFKAAGAGRAGGGAGAKWIAAGLVLLLAGAAAVAGAGYWYVNRGGGPATDTTASVDKDAPAVPAGEESPAATTVTPITPAGLAALIEGAGGGETEASPSPSGGGRIDGVAGRWAGTYGPMNYPATMQVEEAGGGKIRGVLEQSGVRVAFEGSVNAATRAVTFKETRVLSGEGWSLGTGTGRLSTDGRTMSGTGQDPFGAQLGMSYQWSFTRQ
jgi:tRNA A-37 threonylcarbamoyl transferase component Bud32